MTRLRPTGGCGAQGEAGRKGPVGKDSSVAGNPAFAELAAQAGEGRRRVLEAVIGLVVAGEADAAALLGAYPVLAVAARPPPRPVDAGGSHRGLHFGTSVKGVLVF